MDPAVLNIWAQLPSWDGISQTSSKHFYDLSQMASLVNRRFYRQGLNWAVGGIKIHFQEVPQGVTLETTPSITISKLPNTWIMSNAWTKGMRAWTKMIREATEESPSLRGRFLDFKIYANDAHHEKGTSANQLPLGHTAGEWDYSTFEIPVSNADPTLPVGNSVTRDVIAVGGNYDAPGASGNYAVSLVEGYAASRALPNEREPNMPDDASSSAGSLAQNWIVALFNDAVTQDAEVIQDLETQNNQAPYPFEGDGLHFDTMYPAGANNASFLEIHDFKAFAGATVGNQITLQGGNFPCGLIEITNPMRYVNAEGTEVQVPATVQFMMVPGNHRGYMAETMLEM